MSGTKGIPPVIILGMHRSGTTMVTKMLEDLGLFVGAEKDDNNESLYFYKINKWAFRVGIAKVDMPDNLSFMNESCKEEIIGAFDYYLGSIRRKRFLGWKYFFAYKDIRNLDFPWGWKEPQNTFTIDYWKTLFPGCKVIHIYRNPMDCANSFIKRDLQKRNYFKLDWKKRLKRFFLVAYKYHQNFRLYDLEQGYRLWESYVHKAFSLEKEFGANMISVKYEDFLDNPVSVLKELVPFCGLSAPDEKIVQVASGIRESRKYAFLKDPEAFNKYQTIKNDPFMIKMGYNDLG